MVVAGFAIPDLKNPLEDSKNCEIDCRILERDCETVDPESNVAKMSYGSSRPDRCIQDYITMVLRELGMLEVGHVISIQLAALEMN